MLLTIRNGDFDTQTGLKALIGDEIIIKVIDLPDEKEIKLHARRMDDKNQLWYSQATFISDDEGFVNTAKSPSVSGKYEGLDPIGLFWSMKLINEPETLPENLTRINENSGISLYFDVEIDGEITAQENMEVLRTLPEIEFENIRENDLTANFYYPSNKNNLPAVIVVSGSEGGISTPDIVASVLASHGYAALALAYFDLPGLPPILEEIPLEYVEKAIKWLNNHKSVESGRLAMMGTSKGAELTLISASMFTEIKAVIAASPSHVIFQSSNPDPESTPKSSWTYKRSPLTFVPFIITEKFTNQFESGFPEHLEYLPLYENSLVDKDAIQKARINVEKINGPILLISGSDDRVWPSKEMAEKVMDKLESFKFPHPYIHLNYEGAGHMVARPGFMPWPTPYYVKGGLLAINGQSQADVWNNILEFLKNYL
jgi:hypothetical protein